MQEQRNDNVISLFDQKKAVSAGQLASGHSEEINDEQAFLEVMRRNAENQQRLRQDRNKANKSVLRSYRIKT